MSASTVSATANPRRRIVNDVKQSIDVVNTTATATTHTANAIVNADDKVTAAKGEAVLERSSKEIKKPSQNPPSGVRTRTRKSTPTAPVKQPRPRWKTILSVLVKNLLLVLVILGLVQMVKKLVMKEELLEGGNVLGFSDMEGRISEVETMAKTMSKMLQVELDVVDQKIESEVGNLRREVGRRVDGLGTEINSKLSEFRAKRDGLEAELRELSEVSKRFVTEDDVVRLLDELRSRKNGNVGDSDVSLDEIRSLAKEIVEKEIEKHAADGLGRVDYALGSGGAKVVKHSEPLMVGKGAWFGSARQRVHENAVRMLSPSFGEPGMCFALKGSSGFVQIRLRTAVVAEAITLEHVAKNVAYDQSSAPKVCRVFGWLQGPQKGLDIESIVDDEKVLIAEFTYDLEKSNAQTYNVLESAESTVIDTVSFEFSSNQGSPTHTCIYRLRVHGHDSNPVPQLA